MANTASLSCLCLRLNKFWLEIEGERKCCGDAEAGGISTRCLCGHVAALSLLLTMLTHVNHIDLLIAGSALIIAANPNSMAWPGKNGKIDAWL